MPNDEDCVLGEQLISIDSLVTYGAVRRIADGSKLQFSFSSLETSISAVYPSGTCRIKLYVFDDDPLLTLMSPCDIPIGGSQIFSISSALFRNWTGAVYFLDEPTEY